MPLNNFGSILTFAEEMEGRNLVFYESAAGNPACADLALQFRQLAQDGRKQVQTIQRTRRENVTEMILEPIRDFFRAPYVKEFEDPADRSREAVLSDARAIEATAEAFYRTAMEKISALPEVARALKTIGKKHTTHCQQLAENI
jgi:rubrerythrin